MNDSNENAWIELKRRFETRVIPSALEYEAAELELSRALNDLSEDGVSSARDAVLFKGMQLAQAIQNFVDYAKPAMKIADKSKLIKQMDGFASLPGSSVPRPCFGRINAAANVEKHPEKRADRLITDQNDILIVGAGWGVDGYGVGKFGGEELLLHSNQKTYKFLGDAAAALIACKRLLEQNGYAPSVLAKSVIGVDI